MGEWISLGLQLNKTSDYLFGTQYTWVVSSDNITSNQFSDGVDFWVINEHQLDGRSFDIPDFYLKI